jgi:hypothetical protein
MGPPNQPPGQPPNRRLQLDMPAGLNADYANSVMIGHTEHEIIMDFIQVMPNMPRARVQRRIVMTPAHAKMFMRALQENFDRYEARFGEIPVPERKTLADQLFGGLQPPEGPSDDASDAGSA